MSPASKCAVTTVDVLGAPVACIDVQGLLQTALAWSGEARQRTLMYANAYALNTAVQVPALREAWQAADLLYADGVSVAWAARWLYNQRLEKMTGADWIERLAGLSASLQRRWFILGGAPGVAELAGLQLAREFPGLQIVGSYYGYFAEAETPHVLDLIRQARPDLLFVGLGTPRQELWLVRHRSQIDAPLCWAVGALFDYVAGVERRVPPWMNKLGLEWLYRLWVDPRGKWRRYLLGNPWFIGRVLQQKLGVGKQPAARKG
jgi:N-acetylglucosaminyldiphosphoundecaprenol N-acetyl-beta-D-mannosaminyltransferase